MPDLRNTSSAPTSAPPPYFDKRPIFDMVEVYTQLLIESYGDLLQSTRYCSGSWLARQVANRTFRLGGKPVYFDGDRTRDLHWALFSYNVSTGSMQDKLSSGRAQYNSFELWVTVIPCSIQTADFRKNQQLSSICHALYSLRHENINVFLGACASVDSTSYLLADDYCSRGTLHDFIFRTGPLDKDFQITFAQDVLKGLLYIHGSSLRFHGKLNGLCCLITGRFLLKIAKTGYQSIQSILREQDERQASTWSNLWRPPEHDIELHEIDLDAERRADIYSLGIVLYEVLTNRQLLRPRGQDRRFERLRPSPFFIDSDAEFVPLQVQNMISNCWNDIPSQRPRLTEMYDKFFAFFPVVSGQSMTERSLLRLERYAQELEIKVALQTRQLSDEETFGVTLRAEMMPAIIVEALRCHVRVEPELFQSVTIYSSDIDGFAELVQFESPKDVVLFLNNLHALLDPLIAVYDVYRVRTVCDFFLIVSGVPVRNSGQHAEVICTMTMKLMKTYSEFDFRQATDLRIGVHTGPVVVGVVGSKAPTYHL
ncbi:hypothetical protein RvY_14762 [Ramazzottius varieornatus]|uniref:guanylate cyclase n=1 Tax=Ramazzottius varieornatus TaxID=947166 RepID=A0A1D1VSE6_RAMVA|nr:hypothetical protein RvY_14762 [Ramazzottius varieornatus]